MRNFSEPGEGPRRDARGARAPRHARQSGGSAARRMTTPATESAAAGLPAAGARWRAWAPPAEATAVLSVDAHAAGEPLRVILGGTGEIPGATMIERRRFATDHLDALRRALMWEPRGHADMYGCIPTPPVTPGADLGVLFLHNDGFSTMCGHGIIALTTVVLELGLFDGETLKIDTPAGLVTAHARFEGDRRVGAVRFRNVPSFVVALDDVVAVPGLGAIRYDLAFGGAFYAYVRADDVGETLSADRTRTLIDKGMAIKRAVAAKREIVHPTDPELGFLYGTIFVGPPQGADAHSRNVCIFANGEVDRSPTGTGVSARAAIHRSRGEADVGQPLVIESLIGSRFTVRVVEDAHVGPYAAVIPEVEGSAWITGRHEFVLQPRDPIGKGFLIR
jgi:proline racemase